MKKIIILCALLVAVAMPLAAQNAKKVAVWETKCRDNSISQFQSTMVRGAMETAVGNTPGYEVFDRSAFDIILKEHDFQRSGVVSDADIRQMGEMAGVQFVIVPEATCDGGNNFYILVKMLDVEKGKFGGVHDALCAPMATDIRKACQNIGERLFGEVNGGQVASSLRGDVVREGQDFTETAFGIDMHMIYVEGGTFVMGCTGEQGGDCSNNESPTRQTTVGSFYIGMLEVTQSQWQKVMGSTIYEQQIKAEGGRTIGVGHDYPMYYVGWEEAKEFCTRLSRQTGRTYRLATEAEWEYAARGGKKSEGAKYSGGWSVDDVAWYDGNSGKSTHRCGTKRPNALGIYDMSGNVWEWCEDWYGAYQQNDNNNPKGAASGDYRMIRGGSCYDGAKRCRVSDRGTHAPGVRYGTIGFRVVVVP